MKTISTEFQNELIAFFETAKVHTVYTEHPSPVYFLEELRPKRIRNKKVVITDNSQPFSDSNAVDNGGNT